MSAISVTGVTVLNPEAPFTAPIQLEISYECLYDLQDGVLGRFSAMNGILHLVCTWLIHAFFENPSRGSGLLDAFGSRFGPSFRRKEGVCCTKLVMFLL